MVEETRYEITRSDLLMLLSGCNWLVGYVEGAGGQIPRFVTGPLNRFAAKANLVFSPEQPQGD